MRVGVNNRPTLSVVGTGVAAAVVVGCMRLGAVKAGVSVVETAAIFTGVAVGFAVGKAVAVGDGVSVGVGNGVGVGVSVASGSNEARRSGEPFSTSNRGAPPMKQSPAEHVTPGNTSV